MILKPMVALQIVSDKKHSEIYGISCIFSECFFLFRKNENMHEALKFGP
jgi:hypothetical protein